MTDAENLLNKILLRQKKKKKQKKRREVIKEIEEQTSYVQLVSVTK